MNATDLTTGETYRTKFTKEREIEKSGLRSYIVDGNFHLSHDQFVSLKTRAGWQKKSSRTF
jgi:hypothetical protein